MKERIFLIGFSFTGKSVVGQKIAHRLGWSFMDTDQEIVRRAGKPIPDIFAQNGEDYFRKLEREAIKRVSRRTSVVVSTGGGAILDERNRELMAASGMVVCLEAKPETIYRRLLKDAETGTNPVVRPLLTGSDPQQRIQFLKEFRQPYYAIAHWTVHTDSLTEDEAAEEVIRGWGFHTRRPEPHSQPVAPSLPQRKEQEAPYCESPDAACVVKTKTASYPIFVDWDGLKKIGPRLRHMGLHGQAFIVSDENVFQAYGTEVEGSLMESGFKVPSYQLPAGEESKSLEQVQAIYDWMIDSRAERGQAVIALGGGVVGDVAGFVAATFLRGLPLVQVPTSLLAMVDSSIGGKVGVNHPRGKNLIGAFYQPCLVLIDPATLKTLPPRELTSGWAEVIKHAFILDAGLFRFLEDHAPRLRALEKGLVLETIRRSVTIKARIVEEDEHEVTGRRTLLNYGHTIGHALEAATAYTRFLHGEAVAIGMMGAALLSEELSLIAAGEVAAQESLLLDFGLPTRAFGVKKKKIWQTMALDKKVKDKDIRWVLLAGIGQASLRDHVPRGKVEKVIERLVGQPAR
ncbi:MAG: 3-dehydroquinate synthase [Chloroflexi bacterium]|nr:3-dehydroquinate synthase [Chloroflexota bacterium]